MRVAVFGSLCLFLWPVLAHSTTWDEPWQEAVVKNADTFVKATVVKTGPKQITLKILKQVAGEKTPEQIIASVKNGFYVTELIGSGVNTVTGDYSRGAVGLWIRDGELAFPVSEVTIASIVSSSASRASISTNRVSLCRVRSTWQ